MQVSRRYLEGICTLLGIGTRRSKVLKLIEFRIDCNELKLDLTTRLLQYQQNPGYRNQNTDSSADGEFPLIWFVVDGPLLGPDEHHDEEAEGDEDGGGTHQGCQGIWTSVG